MGTITAQKIVDDAQIVLQDTGAVRWAEAELFGWLNHGQRELVGVKPTAYVKNETVEMAAGTKQSTPSGATGLVAVVRNMGSGSTPGPAVKPIALSMMDALVPDWHSATANGVTQYYMTDPGNIRNFYLYPPQPATPTSLELVYPCIPADVAAIANAITLDDIYAVALMDYILFRAFAKDAETANESKAGAYYKKFIDSLGA